MWDYATLDKLAIRYPRIRTNLGQILIGRLDELEERFREMATEKVAKRLSCVLLRLGKHVGRPVQEGVELSLTRDELAQMTGTTLFTISRILSRWGQTGAVIPRREAIILSDTRWLELASDEEF
jgi:CRP-like cAMP-binding protein